jgi:phosphoglycolate phosphatase-like HAD superfamily hydrolase
MLATGVPKDKTLYIGDSILDTIAGFLADVDTVKTVQEAMVFPY